MEEKIAVFEKNAPPSEEKAKGKERKPTGQKKTVELQLLPLLTYRPVGNPLEKAPDLKRQVFFDSLSTAAKKPASPSENFASLRNIVPHTVLLAMEAERAKVFRMNTELAASQAAQKEKAAHGQAAGAAAEASQERQATLAKKAGQAQAAQKQSETQELLAQKPLQASLLSGALLSAQQHISFVLDDYARGDAHKASSALSDFESRIKAQNYASDDLMAVLLLVIEDKIWGGEEGAVGGSKKFGARVSAGAVPQELRQTAKESSYVRLASVREMLRYYFKRNPRDYSGALALALSLSADEAADQTCLQERLSYVLAKIGGFALAQKLLAAIKLQKEMDTKKCLLELGYRYDVKRKKLVLGKRTCGTPSEARGIVGLLTAAVKK